MSSTEGGEQSVAAAPVENGGGDAPPPAAESTQATPTLNNLLAKPASDVAAASPQPMENGVGRPDDKYAATAAAVAAGGGATPAVPKHAKDWPPGAAPASPHSGGEVAAVAAAPPTGAPPVAPQPGQPMPPHPGMPPHGYPPQQHPAYPMPGHPAAPPPGHPYWQQRGYPPMGYYGGHPGGAPPPQHPGYPGHPGYPPQMMRPPGPGADLVKMPNGLTPTEWAAQQRGKDGGPGTPSSVPVPSPAPSSAADESIDEKTRMDSPAWSNQGVRTPGAPPLGAPVGAPMHGQHPGMMMHPGMQPHPQHPQHPSYHHGMPPQHAPPPQQQAPPPSKKDVGIVDRLVGPPSAHNPPHVMPERRAFFERLARFCEAHGDPILMPPQVSKQNVDLHRLYIAVRNRGGFEQVTKDKAWKALCADANTDISESSAAGYQLRKHYQKYLLRLECVETGKSADDALEFAAKLVKKKKDSGAVATPGGGTPGPAPGGAPPGPYTGGAPGYPGHPGGDPMYNYAADPRAWPPGAAPPGYPPGYRGGPIPPGQPMRAPMPQHMMPGGGAPADLSQMDEQQRAYYQQQQAHQEAMRQQHMQQQQQAAAAAAAAAQQQGPASVQPGTPASQPPGTPAGSNLQVDTSSQAGSRAPSAGPPAAATPDSSSRMSAGGEESRQTATPGQGPSQAPTPAPAGVSAVPPPGQPPAAVPSTSMAGGPVAPGQQPPTGYYGQPAPMYSNAPPRPGMPPPGSYPPGSYPPPPQHQYPPGMSQQQQQYMMWQQQQQQQRAGYPGQGGAGAQGAGGPPPQQRPPYYPQPPQPRMPPAGPPHSAPSPGGSRMRYPPQATPSAGTPQQAGYPQQMQSRPAYPSGPQQQPFPAGSVEATTISQQRRRKLHARDLIQATPRRLLMALRCGLEAECVWALNALNVLLYDDSATAPQLAQMPGLLSILVEHAIAGLSVLYPDTFKVSALRERGKESVSWTLSELCEPGERTEMKPVVKQREHKDADKKNLANYTKLTRTGRKVHVEKAELPESLRLKLMMPSASEQHCDETLLASYLSEKERVMAGPLADRLAARLRDDCEMADALPKPRFGRADGSKKEEPEKKEEDEDGVVPRVNGIVKTEAEEEEEEASTVLLCRKATKKEKLEGLNEVELETRRPTALTQPTETIEKITQRVLSVSNVLRGFSFLPGNEAVMCRHSALLGLLGRFLTLKIHERPIKRVKPNVPSTDACSSCESAASVHARALSLLEEEDPLELVLRDAAVQLREDAFVVLSHLSGGLDMLSEDESVSWPVMNGLLHWATSPVAEAGDPLPSGTAISPKMFSLEILCKMSVLDGNVDLLLHTGAWPRIARLIKALAAALNMAEETHNREFCLVILSAMCNACDAVCAEAALETPAIQHLIAFIEAADQNMHHVMQTQGMGALRDNPELMGTSVGMLRRAAAMLRQLARVDGAPPTLARHQQRLLQFTMSQLMDSRVAGMVADTLFEVQCGVKAPSRPVPVAAEPSPLPNGHCSPNREADETEHEPPLKKAKQSPSPRINGEFIKEKVVLENGASLAVA